MQSIQERYGDWALITGASSGLGKEFADYKGALAKLLVMNPDEVVQGALKNLGRKTIHIAGLANRLTVLSFRLFPRWLVARIYGRAIRELA